MTLQHNVSPNSPIDQPAKRQCRVFQAPEDEPNSGSHPKQASNDSGILLRLCDEHAMVLCDRKLAVRALCSGVLSALQANDPQARHVGGFDDRSLVERSRVRTKIG